MTPGPRGPVGWHTRLVRAAGAFVPRGLRPDWVREWEAELQSRETELREWGLIHRRVSWRLLRDSTGALWDALWLQTHRWEDEMIQDIRFGLRLVRRSPWLSGTAIASLAIGIGATTAVFTVINAAMLKALPYPAIERLVAVLDGGSRYFSLAEYRELESRATTIQHLSAIHTRDFVLSADGQPEQVRGQRVSASFPTLTGLDSTLVPVVGRSFAPSHFEAGHPAVVLISHRLWVRRFASDPAIVGKAITLDAASANIIGVLPAGFDLFPNSDVLEPLRLAGNTSDPLYRYLEVLGRLPAADAVERVQTELTALNARPGEHSQIRLAFVRDLLTNNVRRALLTMWAMTVLVLMVACLNFANLLTARATARQQELAVRASLGGRRLRLIRQLIVEALVLVAIGGGLGLLVAHFGAGLLVAAMSQHFLGSSGVSIDARVILFALLLSSICGVVFAAFPALHVSANAQREGGLLSIGSLRADPRSGRRVHTVLASLQVALTLALLVGAALFVKSFWHLARIEPGYQAGDAVSLQFNLPASAYRDSASVIRFTDALDQRLRGLPGVLAVGATSNLPLIPVGMEFRAFTVENGPIDVGPPEVMPPGLAPPPPPPPGPPGRLPATPYFQAVHIKVGPNFFGTMRIPLLAGRDFTTDDREGTLPVTIVNRAFADRYFPGVDPIGRRIKMSPVRPWMTVVGVVGNIRRFARDDVHRSEFYRPFAQGDAVRMADGPAGAAHVITPIMMVVRTPRGPDDVARSVRGILAALDPALPIAHVSTLQGDIDDAVAQQRLLLRLFLAFAGATLVLAAVGVYGVTTYIVSRRQHEMAVRVALGAHPSSIEALVVRQGLPVIVIGLALGLGTSVLLSRYVGEYLFRVSPLDGWAYVAVAAILAIVVVIACYLPARRAGRSDPLIALKGS